MYEIYNIDLYWFIRHLILFFHVRHQFSQQDLNSKMIVQRFLALSRGLLPHWNHPGPHSCYGTMIFQRVYPVLQIVRCMNTGEVVSMSSWWKSRRHPKLCKQKLIVDARRERNLSFDPQRGANEIIEPRYHFIMFYDVSLQNDLWCFIMIYASLLLHRSEDIELWFLCVWTLGPVVECQLSQTQVLWR